MYLINRDEELTAEKLGKMLSIFSTKDLPRLRKLRNYYDGKQAILRRQPSDEGRPDNRVVVNYMNQIVQTYDGYLTGVPVTYDGDDSFSPILDILEYNDVCTEDTEYLRQALIYGKAFEVAYIDKDGQQRFRLFDTRECIDVYDNTLDNDLLYVVRFYREDLLNKNSEDYIVEVYSQSNVRRYKSNAGFSSFILIDETPHFYGQCPVTVFNLNEDNEGVFAQVMDLQDAYNTVMSDLLNITDDFTDAYLVLTGLSADDDDLKAMKKHKCLMLDEGCEASYLTKNIGDSEIQDILGNISRQIYNKSLTPDFSDKDFMAQSGEAIKYKLVGFKTKASTITNNMKKALIRRIELISTILNIKGDDIWASCDIIFTENLPINLNESSEIVNKLSGIVSKKTLLSILPFVKDVDEELNQLMKEREEDMAFYVIKDNDEVIDNEE